MSTPASVNKSKTGTATNFVQPSSSSTQPSSGSADGKSWIYFIIGIGVLISFLIFIIFGGYLASRGGSIGGGRKLFNLRKLKLF